MTYAKCKVNLLKTERKKGKHDRTNEKRERQN